MTLADIIPEERGHVDELRRRFKQQMSEEMFEDDSLFQRFLRARNHDLNAAESMLRKHLNWRKANEVDTINEYNTAEVLRNYLSINFLGYDKEGSTVGYIHFGGYDTRGILKSTNKKEIHAHIIKCIEDFITKTKEQSKKMGRMMDKCVYIFNFENLSLSVATHKPTLEHFYHFCQLYEANYPERLKVCYFINVSFVFTLGWTLVKPFLSGPTVKKVFIYGKDGWQSNMLSCIDADVLPAFLGGNKTDPDGDSRCKSSINFGGPVPESYYVDIYSSKPSSLPGAKIAIVNPLSKMELKFEVIISGSRIQWEFLVKNRDIAYSLLFKMNGDVNSEVKNIIPKERRETESGVYTCQETGIYILEFDNTYSWLHSKEVHYITSLSRPEENKLNVE